MVVSRVPKNSRESNSRKQSKTIARLRTTMPRIKKHIAPTKSESFEGGMRKKRRIKKKEEAGRKKRRKLKQWTFKPSYSARISERHRRLRISLRILSVSGFSLSRHEIYKRFSPRDLISGLNRKVSIRSRDSRERTQGI